MNRIETRLSRAFGPTQSTTISFGQQGSLSMGFEIITPEDHYLLQGMRRGGDDLRPIWLFQYTLSGWGSFETGQTQQKITPGKAFAARIPSAHQYSKATGCKAWSFFWIIVNHPYVVGRLLNQSNLVNALIDLPENSPSLEAAVSLCLSARDRRDNAEVESKLFFWMMEMERFAFAQRHPREERTEWLDFVREWVLQRLEKFVTVEELAKHRGVSRSNFAHSFSKITGMAPAACIREIRIQEAARLLREQKWSVKEVAAKTGFSSVSNLCKCFRSLYQISPAHYRRTMGRRSSGFSE